MYINRLTAANYLTIAQFSCHCWPDNSVGDWAPEQPEPT